MTDKGTKRTAARISPAGYDPDLQNRETALDGGTSEFLKKTLEYIKLRKMLGLDREMQKARIKRLLAE